MTVKWFERLPIQGKLITINMITSVAVLTMAVAAFAAYEIASFRRAVATEVATIAELLAGTSEAAVAFRDARVARETLNVLERERRVQMACLYAGDSARLASYQRTARLQCPARAPEVWAGQYDGDTLAMSRPITVDGKREGTVHIVADLQEMNARLMGYAAIAAGVLFGSVLVAALLSSILQRVVSRPILDLAATASRVSVEQNYSIRATRRGEDETGMLVDRFNEMLSQIHARDLALQQAQDELEDRVELRTAELQAEIAERQRTERELIAAKQVAEESDRAKSAFLANMSHELRTPLNAIIGYSEMLAEDAEDEGRGEVLSDLGRIRSAGAHLLALINDVLDLSKIEAGRLQVRMEPIAVHQVVEDAVGAVEPLARKGGNRLTVQCDDPDMVVEADVVKFRQSLLNLLSNACKFTEGGEVKLEVAKAREEGKTWVEWRVSDTGIGIAEEDMGRLFQSFSQVDSSATRKFGGTGLGLAISQRLCHMMGGEIRVASEVGVGSTFTIRLPYRGEEAA